MECDGVCGVMQKAPANCAEQPKFRAGRSPVNRTSQMARQARQIGRLTKGMLL